jgi:hypothetical protein
MGTFSPANYQVNEGTQFSLVVSYVPPISDTGSVTDIGNVIIPVITSANVTPLDPGISLSFSGLTFTVSGKFLAAFKRNISYLDNNLNEHVVTSFAALPTGFATLHQYIAPTEAFINVYVNITLSDHSSAQYEIIVRNDFVTANNALRSIISTRSKF